MQHKFPDPRRVANGVELSRVSLLLAVMADRLSMLGGRLVSLMQEQKVSLV